MLLKTKHQQNSIKSTFADILHLTPEQVSSNTNEDRVFTVLQKLSRRKIWSQHLQGREKSEHGSQN